MTMCVLIALLGVASESSQADVLASQEKVEASNAMELARQEVAKYDIRFGSDEGAKLKLRPEPILRWTSHLGRRFYGDVFLWTADGRPEVVASITNLYGSKRVMETEMHTLSLDALTAKREGRLMWEPSQAGLSLQPIPNAPRPAESKAARLRQMRVLARQFSAKSIGDGREFQLRLLTQPIYRYDIVRDTGPLDGGMFALAKGTDPDVFLLLESRRTIDGHQWQFALARFNGFFVLRVFHQDKEVWSAQRLSGAKLKNPKSAYFAFHQRFSSGEASPTTTD